MLHRIVDDTCNSEGSQREGSYKQRITIVLKQDLEKQGFRGFGFTDPLLELEHFKIIFKQYGLVISDLRMPGMNGYEFIKRVKGIKSEVKVFLMHLKLDLLRNY